MQRKNNIVIEKDENWYVIENSSKKEEYILLLSSKLLDLNFNNEIDIDDKVDYISANLILDKYIEKNNRMRFLTSQEYIGIRDNMNFGYFWEKPNWLAGEIKHNWWINSENSKFNYSINLNGKTISKTKLVVENKSKTIERVTEEVNNLISNLDEKINKNNFDENKEAIAKINELLENNSEIKDALDSELSSKLEDVKTAIESYETNSSQLSVKIISIALVVIFSALIFWIFKKEH